MTNETLLNKLKALCNNYIIDSKYSIDFENRSKKNFFTIIDFLGYYVEDNEEVLIVKRTVNSKSAILEINKKEKLKEYENWRQKKYEKIRN